MHPIIANINKVPNKGLAIIHATSNNDRKQMKDEIKATKSTIKAVAEPTHGIKRKITIPG